MPALFKVCIIHETPTWHLLKCAKKNVITLFTSDCTEINLITLNSTGIRQE
jgi:hypothetical protein